MKRNYSILDEKELLLLLKEDDEKAFREIYVRFHDFLYRYVYKLTRGDEQGSQDILQTLFLNLWNKRNDLNISGKLYNYLNQGVRYGFLNQERSKGNLSRYQDDLLRFIHQGKATTEDYIFEKELTARLRKLAEEIPGKGGEAFLLFHLEQYSHAQIAEALGVSEKTVKNLLSKSTKDIRLKIGLSLTLLFLLP